MKTEMLHGSVDVRNPEETHGEPEVFLTISKEFLVERGGLGSSPVHISIEDENGREAIVHLHFAYNAVSNNIQASMRIVKRNTDVVRTAKIDFVDWNR